MNSQIICKSGGLFYNFSISFKINRCRCFIFFFNFMFVIIWVNWILKILFWLLRYLVLHNFVGYARSSVCLMFKMCNSISKCKTNMMLTLTTLYPVFRLCFFCLFLSYFLCFTLLLLKVFFVNISHSLFCPQQLHSSHWYLVQSINFSSGTHSSRIYIHPAF